MRGTAFHSQTVLQLVHNVVSQTALGVGTAEQKWSKGWDSNSCCCYKKSSPSFNSSRCPPPLQQGQQQLTSCKSAGESKSCLSCITFMNNCSLSASKKRYSRKINSAHRNSFQPFSLLKFLCALSFHCVAVHPQGLYNNKRS